MSPRPSVPTRPCPACGKLVDPLRAGRVLAFESGAYRYLCDERCVETFRAGERVKEEAAPKVDEARLVTLEPQTETQRAKKPREPEDASAGHTPLAPSRSARVAGLACVVAAVLGALLGEYWIASALASALCVVAVAWAAMSYYAVRHEVGWLATSVPPAGALLAIAAALARTASGQAASGSLVAAAVASAALVAKAWLDERGRAPVHAAVASLERAMPTVARRASGEADGATQGSTSPIDGTRIRTGEEILVLEGERTAVDGVVKAGEAWAVLHPGSDTPVPRAPGDPLLAGARIVKGAVRLVATRVGEDRVLARPARFGSAVGRDAAPVARIARVTCGWGGLAVVLIAASSLVISDGEGFAAQISAAAAVLLAAPLLAIRRGAEGPLVAGAAAAAARGIGFQNARALETAGRAACAALCTHGTITEGVPEVTEAQAIGNERIEPLLALAAAAESTADPHPIARAILRFAESRKVAPESVRRAMYLPGRGVTALGPGGEALVIGNRHLLLDEGVSVAIADADAARAESRGRTCVFIGLGGRVRAFLALSDNMRPAARAAVQRLMDIHLELVLLSGDHRATVEALARALDIHHVKAELLPDERGAEVRRLREAGGPVAVVGRPVHDDAALAAADMPIVIGAAGGPAGERGIALATEDIRDASSALWIARAARDAATRSVGIGVSIGLAAAVAAALGYVGPLSVSLLLVLVDAYVLHSGARLLRRIALRIPVRS